MQSVFESPRACTVALVNRKSRVKEPVAREMCSWWRKVEQIETICPPVSSPQLFADTHLNHLRAGLCPLWNNRSLFCLLLLTAVQSTADNFGVIETNEERRCVGITPSLDCTALGEISGNLVIREQLEACSTSEAPNPSELKERWESKFLYQFQVAEQSSLVITTKGWTNLSLYSGYSMTGRALQQGVSISLALPSGTYTLAAEAPQCTGEQSEEDIQYRIEIEVHAGMSVDEDPSVLQEAGVAVARTVVVSVLTAGMLAALTVAVLVLLLGFE